MSVVQYAKLCGKRILLTGDAGRAAMIEAAEYAPYVGLSLPGIDCIQIPHHGSRHNVSMEVFDKWLGERLDQQPSGGSFSAIVSALKEDGHHPRKSVVRGFIHRGAKVITTGGSDKRTGHNAPDREGWVSVEPMPYPEDQED